MSPSSELLEEQLAAVDDDAERLRLLNLLVNTIFRTDPRRSLLLAEEACTLARALEDRRGEADSLWSLAVSYETLSNYSEAMRHARSAYTIYTRLKSRREMADALNAIGVIAIRTGDYATALDSFREALIIFEEEDRSRSAAQTLNNIAAVHEAVGNFPEALDTFLQSLRISESAGNDAGIATASGNIANIYFHLGDFDKAFDYDSRALALRRQLDDSYGLALNLGNIASLYQRRGEYDPALDALGEALDIVQRIGERRYEATTRVELGSLYEKRNEPKRALEELREAVKIAESIGSDDTVADASLRIGRLSIGQRAVRRAITTLRKGLLCAERGSHTVLESDIRLSLAEALAGAGEHAEAYEQLSAASRLKGEIYSQERQRAIAESQARFDLERAERERELFRLKSEHLEEMMELRGKELTALAMQLVQKKTFLQKLREQTIQLSEQHPESKGTLKHLLREITANLHGEDDWQRFENEFQLVHHDFVRTLSTQYPKLTPTELKVCALLKINLSNKEIADLLSVSLRNVESHRYSIRKKLALPSEVNLSVHLASM